MGKGFKKNISFRTIEKYERKIPMKNINTDTTASGCAIIAGLLVAVVLSLFLSPLLLMLAWNLAIVALFPSLPIMSYWVAFGVNLFFYIIGGHFKSSFTQNIKDFWN